MIRIGTCAFTDHQGLYPPGLPASDRLRYYSTQFDVVEVDATFYRPMARHVAVRWASQVPRTFRLDLKAPGSLTGHRKPDPQELQLFMALLEPLAADGILGAVLLQWPPWHRQTPDRRQQTAEAIHRLGPHPVAVEFRHRSWYEEPGTLLSWLAELGAAHVVVDAPDAGDTTVPWLASATQPDLAYVRFHGRNAETWAAPGLTSSQERFRYRYEPAELEERARDIRALGLGVREVHVLMNNNYGSYAVDGARWLRDHLVPKPGTQMGFPF